MIKCPTRHKSKLMLTKVPHMRGYRRDYFEKRKKAHDRAAVNKYAYTFSKLYKVGGGVAKHASGTMYSNLLDCSKASVQHLPKYRHP